MFRTWRFVALSAVTAGILAACAGNSPIDVGPGGGDDDDDGSTPSFATDVVPAFASGTTPSCSAAGCHTGGTPQGGIALGGGGLTNQQIYDEIMQGGLSGMAINTANAATSLLLTKPDSASAGVTHTGGKLWQAGDAPYDAVHGWIQAGAPNN